MASAVPIRELTVILARFGCRNRPFYKIVVIKSKIKKADWDIVEQLGAFDPIPNDNNEKLVAFDLERIKYWLGRENVTFSDTVLELLGLSGFLPIHPKTYIHARKWRAEGEHVKKLIEAFNSPKEIVDQSTTTTVTSEKEEKVAAAASSSASA